MSKINVVYWSQTGNTQAMAEAIADGISQAGQEAVLKTPSEITADELAGENLFALGCPAMGAEVLEEEEMEPLMTELDGMISGKKLALFGSYGWGDGEWMRDWEERVKNAGATLIGDEGLMCNEAPDEDGIRQCIEFGKKIASSL